MDEDYKIIVPKSAESVRSDNVACVAGLVAFAVVIGGTYYAVRRGIDRKVAQQLKKHLDKEQ